MTTPRTKPTPRIAAGPHWANDVKALLRDRAWRSEAELMLGLAHVVTPERAIAAARRKQKRRKDGAALPLETQCRFGVRQIIRPVLARLLKSGAVERDASTGQPRWRLRADDEAVLDVTDASTPTGARPRPQKWNTARILADAQDMRDRERADREDELQRHTNLLNAWRQANARAVKAERIPRTFLAKRDEKNQDRKAKHAEHKALVLAEATRLQQETRRFLDRRLLYPALLKALSRHGLQPSRSSLLRYLKDL